MDRISRHDSPNLDIHNTQLPCVGTVESELVIGWSIWPTLCAHATASAKFDSKNISHLKLEMDPFRRMDRHETSHMLFIWTVISETLVDDFESSTDKRERSYDPMVPGLRAYGFSNNIVAELNIESSVLTYVYHSTRWCPSVCLWLR